MNQQRCAPELVIFDCDGVLVDSDRISLSILAEEVTKLGVPMSADECTRRFLGIGVPATLTYLTERLGEPLPDTWEQQWRARVFTAFDDRLEAVSGVKDALDAITLPTCVASGSSHARLRRTLGLTGLYDRFAGRIFSADDVQHGKPAPDVFLHAANSLTVEPAACVVIEDAPSGVAAANAAGMRVLAYVATTPRDLFDEADSTFFDDMRQLPALLAALT